MSYDKVVRNLLSNKMVGGWLVATMSILILFAGFARVMDWTKFP